MQINVKQNFNENISFQYKNIEFLKACDRDIWKEESSNIINISSMWERFIYNVTCRKNKFKVVYAVEILYSLVGNNIIKPISFSIN